MSSRSFSSPPARSVHGRARFVSLRRGVARERGGFSVSARASETRAELRVSHSSSRPPPGRVAGWRLPRKRGTRETKKEEEASSETRRLRVGARGVRADAIEMRTFSRVLPLRSDANMRAARFAVRNPPFARRGSVHSRARRSTYTKYRPTALTNSRTSVQLADGEDSPPLRSRFESPFVWRFSLAAERRKKKKKN